MTRAGRMWTNKYGDDFLQQIVDEDDWRSVEALWRWGSTTDLPALAKAMAQSRDSTLAMLLGVEVTSGRCSAHLPGLPSLLHLHTPIVSKEIAARVLARLGDEAKPLPPPYAEDAHLLIAWLLHQPGSGLDDLAIEIAVGAHTYSDRVESSDAAIARIASSAVMGARLIEAFARHPDWWETGSEWTKTANTVARAGTNAKGRADLVRTLTASLLELPPPEPVEPTPEFVALMERHAARNLSEAFDGEELANVPGTAAAVRAVAQFTSTKVRDDLIESLAAKQPTLWSAFRKELYDGWSVADWDRMLNRWATDGSVLAEAGQVVEDAPSETATSRIRVAFVHGTEPGDFAAGVASRALKLLAGGSEDAESDIGTVVTSVPWDLVVTAKDVQYVDWILNDALAIDDVFETVMRAYASDFLSAEYASALTPDSHFVEAFGHIAPGPKRAQYAAALRDGRDAELVEPILREVIAASNDTFDVIEAVAGRDSTLAFESFDEDRWHDLHPTQKDQLVALLEAYATLAQADLLDMIAFDSDGPNAGRRARAAKCWSELTALHSMIPPGVLSLLESAQPKLNEAFAEVAAKVQPRDERTLVSLQGKWLSGGKTGNAARAALDTVAEGVVTTLADLRPPDRRDQCPSLLHILGVTAAPSSFGTLISYVGADAVDDNAGLRRAAAAAIREFVNVTRLNGSQLDALGSRLTSETDPTASEDLRTALAAADLGDDAAILGLYDIAGLAPGDVPATPDELFGSQKTRLLLALKKMRVQEALGESGWDGFVEQMDLVGEALVRTAYLRFGPSAALKKQITSNKHNEPDYGSLVKAFASTAGFGPASANLQTIHNIRTTQTAAHHPSGGELDAETVAQAENALRTAARAVLDRLIQDEPVLRAVPVTGSSEEVS